MKLAGRDAARFLARPDPAAAGMLLFGADAMRVALKRAALVEALIGPEGAAEMRTKAAMEVRRALIGEPVLSPVNLPLLAGARCVLPADKPRPGGPRR